MNLEGLVEDVHLEEVLRVLAVAGRSGTLHVQGPEESGYLTLVDGKLVAARMDGDRTTVEEVLTVSGVLDPETLKSLTPAQRKKPLPGCLGDLLVVAPELEEDVPRQLAVRLHEITALLLGIKRGTFTFSEGRTHPPPCYLGDQGVAVAEGISGEAEATSARQERVEHGPRPRNPTRTHMPAVEGDTPDLLVVDNDPALLADITERATTRGLKVRGVATAKEGILILQQLGPNGHTVAVVDLVMPRVDGRGILGGLDLLRRIRAEDAAARVIMTTEVDNKDADLRAREMGVAAVVRKPAVGTGGPQDMVTFADALLAAAGFSDRAGSVDLGLELLTELGEAPTDPRGAADGPQTGLARGLELLRDMVGPVNDPERRDEIPLMILRVAASSFSRAALFLITDAELVGLGGFGLDANNRDPGKALRDTHIPLEADTVLASAHKERRTVRVPFFASEWNRYLADRLGGPVPNECYVAPVFCARQVEAVLYCDNATDGTPLGDTQVLDLFLVQAGAAMERAVLERRLVHELNLTGAP